MNCVTACTHCDSVAQTSFSALKFLCAPPGQPSLATPTMELFTVPPMVLPLENVLQLESYNM